MKRPALIRMNAYRRTMGLPQARISHYSQERIVGELYEGAWMEPTGGIREVHNRSAMAALAEESGCRRIGLVRRWDAS